MPIISTAPARIGGTIPGGTTGSLLFIDSDIKLAQDNANLFWDDTNNRLITPTLVGGTATTSDLTLQTTSGVGASGADMHFLVGNNGATEAMTILNSGNVGINNTSPGAKLQIDSATASAKGLILKTTDDSATNNLFQVQNSAGTALAYFAPSGFLTIGRGTAAGTTTPTLSFRGSDQSDQTPGKIDFYGSGDALQASIRKYGGNFSVNQIIFNMLQIDNSTYKDVFTFFANGTLQAGTSNATTNGQMVFYNSPSESEAANITIGNMQTPANSNSSIRFDSYVVGTYRAKIVAETPTATNVSGNLNFYVNNGTTLTSRFFIKNDGTIGIGTSTPTNLLSLGGNSARTFWMERHTTANTAGNSLTIQAGGATSAATDKNGGDLIISSGIATGTGSSGIQFQTATAGATGTADRTPATTFQLNSVGSISEYANVTTAGWGVPAIYGSGRATAQTARSAALATYTVGATDGSFEVSGNVNVTTSTTHSFSLDVEYTDETNTARVLILPMAQLAGAFVTGGLITNVTGAGPYESPTMHIRCKTATTITIRPSAGTFTSIEYNAEGSIRQIS